MIKELKRNCINCKQFKKLEYQSQRDNFKIICRYKHTFRWFLGQILLPLCYCNDNYVKEINNKKIQKRILWVFGFNKSKNINKVLLDYFKELNEKQ